MAQDDDDDWLYEPQMAVIRVVATPRRQPPSRAEELETEADTSAPTRTDNFRLTADDLALRILQTNRSESGDVIHWYETRNLHAKELSSEESNNNKHDEESSQGRIGVDASLTLLSRPGEEERILQAV